MWIKIILIPDRLAAAPNWVQMFCVDGASGKPPIGILILLTANIFCVNINNTKEWKRVTVWAVRYVCVCVQSLIMPSENRK